MSHDRIRVAYLSADFCEHAVAYLVGRPVSSGTTGRVSRSPAYRSGRTALRRCVSAKTAFERFIDVGDKSDREIADLVARLEIDIAVDLMGYTGTAGRASSPGVPRPFR